MWLGLDAIINDDFCDCKDGTDEPDTNACSHKFSIFRCKLSGILNKSIHSSKLLDGVCDCCDGSDEEENGVYNISCPNTCEKELSKLRQIQLSQFRSIQAGRKVRGDLLLAERRKKLLEQKNFESLLEEKSLLTNLWLQLKIWNSREEVLERAQRVRLLRERESRCALGEDEACDLFHAGWLDGDQLPDEGLEALFANTKQRLHYHPTSEQLYQQSRLSGLARVRYSLCMETDLLPDGSVRIFDTVGEFETFYAGPGAAASLKQNVNTMRKNTLFGPFLENGKKGYLEGATILAEFLGIVISPVTVPVQLTWFYLSLGQSAVWSAVTACASTPQCQLHWASAWVTSIGAEGSTLNAFNDYAEYVAGNMVDAVLEYISPVVAVPMWISSVAWGTPKMYYDFYWNVKSQQLPPSRNCCLLREGIRSAELELAAVTSRIEEHDTKLKLKAEPAPTKADKKKKMAKAATPVTPVTAASADFGLDGSWELVQDICVEKTFSKYKYQFCFFGSVKQGTTLLGSYLGWGTRNLLVNAPDKSDQKKFKRVSWRFPESHSNSRTTDRSYFTSQVYSEGAVCQGNPGLGGRITEVQFQCGVANEIVDVNEVEICVYGMVVATPLACSDALESQVLEELDRLKVFGFTTPSKLEIEVK